MLNADKPLLKFVVNMLSIVYIFRQSSWEGKFWKITSGHKDIIVNFAEWYTV